MKVQRKINANTVVEAEAPSMVELFEQLSQLEEIFRPVRHFTQDGPSVTKC